jgi:PTH1 family peptidyl-tRNA hydrolase
MDSGDFLRVRLGIGRPPGRQDPADFVLRPFASTERKDLPTFLERAADGVEMLVSEGLAKAQSAFND